MKPEKWWPIGLRNPAYRNGASRALADLEDILAYSWDRFPSTTAQFGNAILDHLEILGVRVPMHSPISIFYRVRAGDAAVEILRLWHAARQRPVL